MEHNLMPSPEQFATHASCRICAGQTRADSYRRLGEPHWIPCIHGANWLSDDLAITVSSRALGEEILLDYRGDVEGAPRIALHRSAEDVITAQGPDGWLDAPGRTRWTWQPAVAPAAQVEGIERIAFTLLSYLKDLRGARGVILIGPRTD